MQRTEIVYKGKKPDITELKTVMPHLDITLTRFLAEDIQTVLDPIYKIKTVDWAWFRRQFATNNTVNSFVFEKTDLYGVGIKDHWGFYSLDEDTKHHFYLTDLGTKLDPRAKANGFKSNFTWMFVHEYLHGAVWGNTRNRELAASLVHKWEEDGLLLKKIEEDKLDWFSKRDRVVSLFEKLSGIVAELLKKKPRPLKEHWNKVSQHYGVPNANWYPITGHHIGTDFITPVMTPIFAHVDCKVVYAGNMPKSLGNYCIVDYNGWYAVYAHLHQRAVVGEYKAGWVLAFTGNTGAGTGAHLHAEGWHNYPDRSKLNKESWRKLTFNILSKF